MTEKMKGLWQALDTKRSLILLIVTTVLYAAVSLLLVYDPVIVQLPDLTILESYDPARTLQPRIGSWWDEDSIVEYLTSGFAAIAGILWLVAIGRARSRGILVHRRDFVLPLLLALLMIVLAGEEISWGQRLLGLETPDAYKALNYQNEITLHNLDARTQKVLYLGTLVWAVLLPLLRLSSRFVYRLAWTWRFPVPPIFLVSLFLSALVFRLYFFDPYGNFAREGMELIFAAAFMAVALHASLRPEETWARPADETP